MPLEATLILSSAFLAAVALFVGLQSCYADLWSSPLARRLRIVRKPPPVLDPLCSVTGRKRFLEDPREAAPLREAAPWRERAVKAMGAGDSLFSQPRIVMGLALSGVVLFGVVTASGGAWYAGCAAAAAPAFAMWRLGIWLRRRRIAKSEAQIPQALTAMINTLRAGQPLEVSLAVASESVVAPLDDDLRLLSQALVMGVPLDEALEAFTQRLPSTHFEFIAAALRMQHRLGGDLTQILSDVSQIVRQRCELINQVHALSAEGRMSGAILMALPLAAFLGMHYYAADYVNVLFVDPIGKKLVLATIVLQLIGALAIRRLISTIG